MNVSGLAFVSVGVAVAKILLRVCGQQEAASILGDAAPLLERLRRPLGVAHVGRKIAKGLDAALQESREFVGAATNDHMAAVMAVTDLLNEQLIDPEWMIDAVIDPVRLHQRFDEHGGVGQRSLSGDAAIIYRIVLAQVVGTISRYAPSSAGFQPAALTQLLQDTDIMRQGIDDLLARPVTGAIFAYEAQAYRELVRTLMPDRLLGRESELAEITEFALHGPGVWYGYQAPPVAGKTALLTTLALNPPAGITPVVYTIRRTQADTTTRRAALTALYAQLAEVIGRPALPEPTDTVHDRTRMAALLDEAAASCQAGTVPTRLLIIIDGIDEDAYYNTPGRATASVLSALPAVLPAGVSVLAARRTNPPLPVDLDQTSDGRAHPLHDSATWHALTSSPHARENIDPEAVDALMLSADGEALAAFLAAAAAPLTEADLYALTCLTVPGTTRARIRAMISNAPGRNLTAIPGPAGFTGYVLGHDTLRTQVLTQLGVIPPPGKGDRTAHAAWETQAKAALRPWQETIRTWAHAYNDQNWPAATPDYLLGGSYPLLLQTVAESNPGAADVSTVLEELTDTLTNPHRIHTLHLFHGTHVSALAQIRTAEQWAVSAPNQPPFDLLQIAQITLADQGLTTRTQDIPKELPALYARLGNNALALTLARTLQDPEDQTRALTGIASALTEAGHTDQAHTIANQAFQVAQTITDPGYQARALTGVASALTEAGHTDQAHTIATQAFQVAQTITNWAAPEISDSGPS